MSRYNSSLAFAAEPFESNSVTCIRVKSLEVDMAERQSRFAFEELVALGRDSSPNNRPRLPLPPMLMFDAINAISEKGGAHARGQVVATLRIAGNPALDWIFACHFRGDPVMPGTFGLEAMWQLTGFFLGWLGGPGRARALGVDQARFTGMVVPNDSNVEYVVDIKRVVVRRFRIGVADGLMKVDGRTVYSATNLRVGLF
jgi:3-hydroxyacyl-[acyl-carrier protein] dehydratase / trans-2-decenoyl-[acyl-carrier protein] isomerase